MTDKPAPKKVRRSSIQKRVSVPTRLEMLMSGELKVEDLSDEEIRRQQLANKDGDFRGRPPKWVPREFAIAFQQEHFRRFQRDMAELVPSAVKAVQEQVNSRHLAPGDATRLRAAELIFERNFGKVTQNVDQHVTVDKGRSFENYVEEALVDVDLIEEADELDEIEG